MQSQFLLSLFLSLSLAQNGRAQWTDLDFVCQKKELIFTGSNVCLFCNALDLNRFTDLNGHALEMPQNSFAQNTALSVDAYSPSSGRTNSHACKLIK